MQDYFLLNSLSTKEVPFHLGNPSAKMAGLALLNPELALDLFGEEILDLQPAMADALLEGVLQERV